MKNENITSRQQGFESSSISLTFSAINQKFQEKMDPSNSISEVFTDLE